MKMARELSFVQSVERSISKTYRERLWTPFITAIKNYKLIEEGDKIAVCISGGKDSMLMAKLIQMLHRHSDVKFDVEYLVMDPGYNEINRQKIESNAKLLEIPITVFETNIFDVANNTERSPCYVCAKMRRGHLYHKAKDLGCNKIALGHHLSDVIETTVMAMFYGSQLQGMMPKITTGCSLSSAPAALPKVAPSATTAVVEASVKKSRRSSNASSAKTRTSKRASSTACTPSASRRSPATRPAANCIRSWKITKIANRRKGNF